MSYGPLSDQDVRSLDSADLISRCAEDTGNTVAWREFVRRFQPKIEQFIRGTLRQEGAREGQTQDLVQNTILRLVENDCIVLRRFSGSTDDEIYKYLAVISRSVVRDSLRRRRATKRSRLESSLDEAQVEAFDSKAALPEHLDRDILAREVASLGAQMIRKESGEFTTRDQLIFDLHYKHGLSTSEIAECSALGLSKSGVTDVLARLTDRLRTAAQAR
jgi:RNA polymerase sigma factor (sigma-70 family)